MPLTIIKELPAIYEREIFRPHAAHIRQDYYGVSASEMHYCPACEGWVRGAARRIKINEPHRKGSASYCLAAGHEIEFSGTHD